MPRQTYWCIACQEYFSSQKTFDNHNATMRDKGIRGHVQCQQCTYVAPDDKAKVMHMRSSHPVLQNLICPACEQGPYRRVDDFVHHIEKGQCGVLTLDKIDDMRRELVLPSRAISAAQGFQQRDDFSEYFGLDRHKVFPSQKLSERPFPQNWDDWTAEPSDPTPVPTEVWPMDEQITNKRPELDINGDPKNPDLEYDEWDRPILPEDPNKEPEGISLLPPWKNLQPGATVADCWNEHMGMYKCPCYMPKICLKVFKTAPQLISHIKAQHNERVYRCPCCMKGFQSLQSLAGHTTSYGQFCKFRRDELFDNFIEQLVGGMIVAERTRNEDGTRNFRISDRALKMFGQKKVPGCATVDDTKTVETTRHRKGTKFGKSGTHQQQPSAEKTGSDHKDAEAVGKRRDEVAAPTQPTDPDEDLLAEDIDWDEWDRKFEVKDAAGDWMKWTPSVTVKDEVKPAAPVEPESSRTEVVRIPKPPKFEVPRIPKPPHPHETEAKDAEVKQVHGQGTKNVWSDAINHPWKNLKQGVSKLDLEPASTGSVPLAPNNSRKNSVPSHKALTTGTANGPSGYESSKKSGQHTGNFNRSSQQNHKRSPKSQWSWKKSNDHRGHNKPENHAGEGQGDFKRQNQIGGRPQPAQGLSDENSFW